MPEYVQAAVTALIGALGAGDAAEKLEPPHKFRLSDWISSSPPSLWISGERGPAVAAVAAAVGTEPAAAAAAAASAAVVVISSEPAAAAAGRKGGSCGAAGGTAGSEEAAAQEAAAGRAADRLSERLVSLRECVPQPRPACKSCC